jgi:hypothetical protein
MTMPSTKPDPGPESVRTHRRPPDALEQLVRAHPALRRVATVVARQPLATEVFAA